MIPSARLVLVALWLLAWPFQAVGGIVIVEKTTTADAPAQTHRVQIDQDWMRMEHQMSGENQAVVFDGAKQVAWLINFDKKTYTEVTKADVDRLGGQAADVIARLQEQLKNMPPERRLMVEQLIKSRLLGGGGAAPRMVYRKVGTDTVGRWTCDKYEGYQNDQKTSEICTVDPSALGFVAADFEVSRKLAEFFKRLVVLPNADNMFSLGKSDEGGFTGVPVKRVFSVGQRQTTTEMTEASRQTFPPSTFEVPTGFRKQGFGER